MRLHEGLYRTGHVGCSIFDRILVNGAADGPVAGQLSLLLTSRGGSGAGFGLRACLITEASLLLTEEAQAAAAASQDQEAFRSTRNTAFSWPFSFFSLYNIDYLPGLTTLLLKLAWRACHQLGHLLLAMESLLNPQETWTQPRHLPPGTLCKQS